MTQSSGGRKSYRNRILLVDDNPGFIGRLQNLFVSNGYLCETALSWKEAVEQVGSLAVDLVICDYRLKGKNGISLIDEAQEERDGVPGLVLCNFGDLKLVLQELQYYPGVRYLTRPFQDDALLAMADTIIRGEKNQKEPVTEKSSSKNYLLDHKTYSHSAMNDLERAFPGITFGCWDGVVDKVKWQSKSK